MSTDAELAPLLRLAIETAGRAYIPYSHYAVGAALRALDGTVYTGCNVENAAYPATICAERTALVKAVSEGRREFDLIVVVTSNGGSPCGTCRQMLFEFAPNLRVVMADLQGNVRAEQHLNDLLLMGFGPEHLPR
jgi:cytidine deaminase